MNEKKGQTDWSTWFSTYGLLTSERILARYNINLPHDELINSVKNPNSIYFQLLRMPLKNIFNGIILQQARDFQIYAQKLFVDYLLSGADAKDKDSPGAATREDIEMARIQLMETGEAFRKVEESHLILIAENQAKLVELTQDLNELIRTPQLLKQTMIDDVSRAEDINISLRSFRNQFYNHILRITELLRLMSDYHFDEEKIAENRSALEFDALIGEE